MRLMLAVTVAALSSGFLFQSVANAQQTQAELRQQIAEANKLKAQVSSQIAGRQYDEASNTLDQLQQAVKRLRESGLNQKDPSIVTLERFVENQRKALDRHKAKTKDSPKKDESSISGSDAPPPNGVSFVKDVAPIFARNCQRCHGQNNPRSKFSLSTFSNLMKGGERGDDDIVPGKPEESRLVLMLNGDEEPRMPQGGRALRSDLIQKIELWVKQGAKFDGEPKFTRNSTLTEMVPSPEEELRMKVAALSDSELLELHRAKAKEHWAASNPSKTPETIETDHFIIMGTVVRSELEQVGQWAETAAKDLGRMFGRLPAVALWRGKLTIHVFADRHEYTEHAMVVENRDLPREIHGHYFAMIETSYGAVQKPAGDSAATLKGLVVEQVTSAYFAARGDAPNWFIAGVGRLLASRSDPKAEIYREYRQQIRESVTQGDPLAVLFDGKGGGEPTVLGFGLVEFLATLRYGDKGLSALATELVKNTPSDKAVQTVYGLDRKTLASTWTQFALKRYPAGKKRT